MLKEKVRTRGIPAGYTGLMYGEHSDLFCTIVNRVIKPKVGTLVMFPSNLKHFASHFESQGVTRTSVSGNIILIPEDIKEGCNMGEGRVFFDEA